MFFMEQSASNLFRDGFLTQSDLLTLVREETAGTSSHTLGCELEVPYATGSEVPKAAPLLPQDAVDPLQAMYIGDKAQRVCAAEVADYGFTVADDELFELQSPPAKSPAALSIALRGLVKCGWLPETPQGMVTAHVSIGTTSNEALHSKERFIRMLRLVELAGATSADRLLEPARLAFADGNDNPLRSWNRRGLAGVDIGSDDAEEVRWEGTNKRVEFRTPQYRGVVAFGDVLSAIHYLSRGLVEATDSHAGLRYQELELWFREYQAAHMLPEPTPDMSMSARALYAYMYPYANHLENNNLAELRTRTVRAVNDLREEFFTK